MSIALVCMTGGLTDRCGRRPAAWWLKMVPFSTVSTEAAGMFAITKRWPRSPAKDFRRIRFVSSCFSRRSAGMFSAVIGLGPDDAGLAEPVAGLEALHAGFDIGVEHGRNAGRLIEVAGDLEALAQRDDGLPLRADVKARAGRHRAPAALRDDVSGRS